MTALSISAGKVGGQRVNYDGFSFQGALRTLLAIDPRDLTDMSVSFTHDRATGDRHDFAQHGVTLSADVTRTEAINWLKENQNA